MQKNDADCYPSDWRTTNFTGVSDANFYLFSIFLHQACIVDFVERLLPYTGHKLE